MHSIRKLATIAASVALVATAACAKADQQSADTGAAGGDTAAAMAAGDTGMAGMDHSNMAGMQMTGDADRDFLRMMSDHHTGMLAMTSEVPARAASATVKADAATMDTKQTAEIQGMRGMLEQKFSDRYEPKVMPDNQKMAVELKALSGKEFDRNFYRHIIMHHQQAIRMVDQYLPSAKAADVKAMAEKMKADQTREIAELERKMAGL